MSIRCFLGLEWLLGSRPQTPYPQQCIDADRNIEQLLSMQSQDISAHIAAGWHYVTPYSRLPMAGIIEIRRALDTTVHITDVADIHPLTNAHGLMWREWRGDTIDVTASQLS